MPTPPNLECSLVVKSSSLCDQDYSSKIYHWIKIYILAHCLSYTSYPHSQKENKYFRAQNFSKKMYYICLYLWHSRSSLVCRLILYLFSQKHAHRWRILYVISEVWDIFKIYESQTKWTRLRKLSEEIDKWVPGLTWISHVKRKISIEYLVI